MMVHRMCGVKKLVSGGGKNHENSASFFGGIGCVFIERLW